MGRAQHPRAPGPRCGRAITLCKTNVAGLILSTCQSSFSVMLLEWNEAFSAFSRGSLRFSYLGLAGLFLCLSTTFKPRLNAILRAASAILRMVVGGTLKGHGEVRSRRSSFLAGNPGFDDSEGHQGKLAKPRNQRPKGSPKSAWLTKTRPSRPLMATNA